MFIDPQRSSVRPPIRRAMFIDGSSGWYALRQTSEGHVLALASRLTLPS